jgi:hypothetical protein
VNTNRGQTVTFPTFSGIRCLMMPYIQGDVTSVPDIYAPYRGIIESVFLKKGDLGFLTIDESIAIAGTPHRGQRAMHGRALHTEAGRIPGKIYCWGSGGGWGMPTSNPKPGPKPKPKPKPRHRVTLDRDVRILLANNLDDSCAVWDAEHENTSPDGDIGHVASDYPYDRAIFMRAGEVHEIGILTPHESLPVPHNFNRQFLRIVSSGVHGREEYFTRNPLVPFN